MTRIIAHRGYSKNYPENTPAAFNAALSLGADGVELDVHASQDGELMVHHDYYLNSSDASKCLIFQQNSSYIKSLKLGQGERIPTLAEVFEVTGKQMSYEIELKGFTGEFLEKVVNLVRHFDLVANVEFTSPSVYNLTKVKELLPEGRTGFFAAAFPTWMDDTLGKTLLINNALIGNIKVLHCPLSIVDESFIKDAHQQGLLVHAADCNTKEALQRAFSVKVDQISTNSLELALAVRSSMEGDR